MSKRFKTIGALRSTHGGRTRSPRAGARPRGPERRWRAAGQGRTGAQPALLPRPRGPARARKGPSRPSGAGGARVRRLGTHPGPPGCPFSPCAAAQTSAPLPHGPDVPPRPPARLLAARSNPAASSRDPTPRASVEPASWNEACGPQPGVRRGRVLRRTEGAYCSNPRGARLRARRSSPVGQEAGRRDLTPYETRPLVGSEVGRSHSRGPVAREVGARLHAVVEAALRGGRGRPRTGIPGSRSPRLSVTQLNPALSGRLTLIKPAPAASPHPHTAQETGSETT